MQDWIVAVATVLASIVAAVTCIRHLNHGSDVTGQVATACTESWTEGVLIGKRARRNDSNGTVQLLWDELGWIDEADPFHHFTPLDLAPKPPSILQSVAAAIVVGTGSAIQRDKHGVALIANKPVPIVQQVQQKRAGWDSRWNGVGLYIEQHSSGVDYVWHQGKMVALKRGFADFDDVGEEVVLTEDGPRALNRAYDFAQHPGYGYTG